MHICYTTDNPVEAHVYSTLLRDRDIPAEIINEDGYVIGYAGVVGVVTCPCALRRQTSEWRTRAAGRGAAPETSMAF